MVFFVENFLREFLTIFKKETGRNLLELSQNVINLEKKQFSRFFLHDFNDFIEDLKF